MNGKKRILIISSILAMFLILILYFDGNFSRKYHHTFTKTTDLSKENVEEIYLGEELNSEKIKLKYGEINNLSQNNSLYNYYFLKNGIEVATDKENNKITRFIVEDKNFKTNKGIQIGDSKSKVIGAYGENYYTRIEQGLDIIGYVDKQKGCSIEFWSAKNEVLMIKFDYNFMI